MGDIRQHFGCSDEVVRNLLKKLDCTQKKIIGYQECSEAARAEYHQIIEEVPVSRRFL